MTNKTLIKLNVELARTAHHAYLDCVRMGLVKLAVDWKLHAQDHMAMARAEKVDAPLSAHSFTERPKANAMMVAATATITAEQGAAAMREHVREMTTHSGSTGRFWDW